MKDGLRFVDSDMHVMEPPDLFERYLDPRFKDRVSVPVGADGRLRRVIGSIVIDGLPTSDTELQQYRKRRRPGATQSTQPLSGSRIADTGRLDFAVERDYNAEAQVMGMAMEGVDIAVLYPTTGLSLIARDNLDPQLSLALCQAYNNWIHDFCQYSPERLKFVAMLPVHDVHLACRELVRCVRELGAVGSFIRPNLVNGHYWHSNYWDPLYSAHQELDVTWGFHEGVSALYSRMIELYGENRFYRHVASHWIEMQQALVAMIIGGVFEFHPKLRVGFLEAQNSWAPGLLSRIEWDYPQYRDSHAPYLSLTPREYFRRNCWAAVEGSEPEIEATAGLIGADRMCVSTDYPHFDSNFPHVAENLLKNVPPRRSSWGVPLSTASRRPTSRRPTPPRQRRERPPGSAERRHHLAGEELHRAQHARVREIAEPEAAVEVRDAHELPDALDLTDARVRRPDDQEAVQEVVEVGLLRRRHRDGAASLHALVVVAQAERHPHVPAGLLGGGPRVGVAVRHVDGALHADLERALGLDLGHHAVEEPAELRHALDGDAEAAREHVEPAAHRPLDGIRALRRDPDAGILKSFPS